MAFSSKVGDTAVLRQPPLAKTISTAILIGVTSIFLLPLLLMVLSSLKPEYDVFNAAKFWPDPIQWDNYTNALNYVPFGQYALNTLFISSVTIIGHVCSCTLIAYGFARLRAPGRDTLFLVVLATLMLPFPVTMVPLYILFKALGWINTFLPLIVPAFFGSPFYIFLLRQFFMTLPPDLEDAAQIDGANTLQIITRIIVPLSWPALATVAIFSFQASWNDFLGPLLYLDQSHYTVALGLSFFRATIGVKYSWLMAASLVTMIPVLIVFIIGQKLFVQGIVLTGVRH